MIRLHSQSIKPRGYWAISVAIAASSMAFGQAPSINQGGVIDAASSSVGRAVSAGNIVSIYGNNLATQIASSDTVPLSTSLSNVSVTFNGIPAALQFVAPTQINAQIPWNVLPAGQGGTVNAVVTSGSQSSAPQPVVVNAFGPGIYQATVGGVQHAFAINATDPNSARYGSFAAAVGSVGSYPAFPAQVNDILLVYAGGLGAVDTTVATGAAPTTTVNTTTMPTMLVNSVPVTPLFSGLSPGYPGVYQVNMRVPQVSPGNAIPFQVQIGGITSTPTTTIAVQ
jgi:uncharacterized protein (TIGR03437 family)